MNGVNKMPTGWLIYNQTDAEKNKAYIDWFIEEAHMQQLSLMLLLREDLAIGIKNNQRIIMHDSTPVPSPDFAIVRTIEPLLNLHLEACGTVVFNSADISRICNNKALTHHYMMNLDIPMVDTLFFKKMDIHPSFPPMPYPFVVKEVAGRGGNQVHFIKETADCVQCVKEVSTDVIVQTAKVKLGKDLRVFIVGKTIIGAVLRVNQDDFRANFTLGGSARIYEPNKKERITIEKIVDHFDFGMVGIDFLIDLNGALLFNEIEDIVGSRTLSSLSNINIVREYVTHIKQTLINSTFTV